MSFYPTILFELTIYFLFTTTAALAFKKHGRNVLLLFGMIVAIALAIETQAIQSGGYEYLGFALTIMSYPISLPLGWCVFFYWAHTFAESLVEWDQTPYHVVGLALLTGVLTGLMSLFLEPGGQAIGWWEYYGPGKSGVVFLGVPAEIHATYFAWGAFDGLIFRLFMYKGWLERKDIYPYYLAYYPALCAFTFFSLILLNIIGPLPVLMFLVPNALLWPIIFFVRSRERPSLVGLPAAGD